jgi:hypothetical protein
VKGSATGAINFINFGVSASRPGVRRIVGRR